LWIKVVFEYSSLPGNVIAWHFLCLSVELQVEIKIGLYFNTVWGILGTCLLTIVIMQQLNYKESMNILDLQVNRIISEYKQIGIYKNNNVHTYLIGCQSVL